MVARSVLKREHYPSEAPHGCRLQTCTRTFIPSDIPWLQEFTYLCNHDRQETQNVPMSERDLQACTQKHVTCSRVLQEDATIDTKPGHMFAGSSRTCNHEQRKHHNVRNTSTTSTISTVTTKTRLKGNLKKVPQSAAPIQCSFCSFYFYIALPQRRHLLRIFFRHRKSASL